MPRSRSRLLLCAVGARNGKRGESASGRCCITPPTALSGCRLTVDVVVGSVGLQVVRYSDAGLSHWMYWEQFKLFACVSDKYSYIHCIPPTREWSLQHRPPGIPRQLSLRLPRYRCIRNIDIAVSCASSAFLYLAYFVLLSLIHLFMFQQRLRRAPWQQNTIPPPRQMVCLVRASP